MKLSHLYIVSLAVNIAGFPLVAGFAGYFHSGSTTWSIAMRAAILGLSVLMIFGSTFRNRIKVVKGWFWGPLLVFWLAYVTRIIVDTSSQQKSVMSRDGNEYLIWAIGACLLPMVALLTYPKKDYLETSFQLSYVMLLLASLLCAFLGSGLVTGEDGSAYETGRLRLEALNPISVGHLGVSLLLLSIWPFIGATTLNLKGTKVFTLLPACLGIYLLVTAASRGPLVALSVVLLFYFFVQKHKARFKMTVIIIVLLLIVQQLGVYLQEAGSFDFFSRSESALSGEDSSVKIRELAYAGAVRQFFDNPVFGDSLEEKTTGFYPHNVVLEAFMSTGLFGGVPFVYLMTYGIFICYKLVRTRSVHGWAALIFLQQLVAAQFSGALYSVTVMWALFAVCVVLYKRTVSARGNASGTRVELVAPQPSCHCH